MSNQINIQGSWLLGILTIPGSIIHIDLAALGISSLNINMPTLVQDSNPRVKPINNNTPNMRKDRWHITATFTRTPPITKVYCRMKLKGRAPKRNNQLQQTRTLCTDHLLYNTNAIPQGFTLKGAFVVGAGNSRKYQQMATPTLYKPIVINMSRNIKHAEPIEITGMEIVP